MQRLVEGNMLLWFLFMGAVVSAPADNKDENNGLDNIVTIETGRNDFDIRRHMVEVNRNIFQSHYEKGHASKDITFNIYDDNMKESTIAIFNMLRNLFPEDITVVREGALRSVNSQMYDYAERMCSLVKMDPELFKYKAKQPPFQLRPHFYVNAETITTALKLRIGMSKKLFEDSSLKKESFTPDIITLNSNYSHWNDPPEGCIDKLDYFREDIGLNAYYFGIHLLHPHWMSNEELSQLNPRHGEDYYFRHQQLVARYNLEKEGLRQENKECNFYDSYSYLTYDNGLPFPIRSDIQGEWSEEKAKLKMVDILLTEYISRGTVVMENGTIINLTEKNHIDLLSNVIRAHYDGDSTAKIMRSLYGYGRNGYPLDQYNPAPSLFHQPETCLRDPGYWFLIQYLLNYVKEYQKSIEPFDVSQYENNDILIVDAEFSPLTTLFENYEFLIDKAIEDIGLSDPIVSFAARKRRLNYAPFVFNFNVISNIEEEVVVRLYLGPPCKDEECWGQYRKYFQLDVFKYKLDIGENIVSWAPENSNRYTTDTMFNKGNESHFEQNKEYNMYKFPQSLLLPKGVENGMNLTLFVIITPFESQKFEDNKNQNTYYNLMNLQIDDRPLGFPFHMPSKNYKSAANNYRFYNVTVLHKKRPADDYYFSPHLY